MNKKAKILISTYIILISMFSVSWSQNAQYEDILASQRSLSPENYYNALIKFQNENPTWPNVYFKLGNVQLEIFSELDPLVDRNSSRQYIANVRTNYSLAKNYVDDKEIRRNFDWYEMPKAKNKDSLVAEVINKVNQNYLNSIKYADNYESLIKNYDNAVRNYLEAREIFIDINNRADNLRQLFLKADNKLKSDIKTCGVHFDSTLYYLDKYRALYQTMPHKKIRKVNVNLIKIDYYRMNGITPTNFLLDDLDLWDYKDWSENFLKLIREEVDELKVELSNAYTSFLKLSDRTINGNECFQANINELKLQRLANIVSKYDNQSLLIDIFQYQQAKLTYGNQVAYENNCNVSNQSPSDNLISRKARILQNLYEGYKGTDSLCSIIGSTNHQTNSFQWFFDKYMSGSTGVAQFTVQQQTENATAIKQNIQKLMALQDRQFYNSEFVSKELKLAGDTITNQTLVDGDKIEITQRIVIDSLYEIFMAKKLSGRNSIYGVRKINEGFRIVWEEPLKTGQTPDYYKMLSDSSLVIGGTGTNIWLKHLGFLGSKKAELRLTGKNPIKNIYFNDLLNSYTIIQELSYDAEGQIGKYQLTKLNSTGKTSLKKQLTLNGKFINVISQDNAYWFFSGSDSEETSVIHLATYDWQSMEKTSELQYDYNFALKDPLVIKNDNLTLTMISGLNNPTKIVYSLIDYEGGKIYEKEF